MKNRKTVWCVSKYASPSNYGIASRLFYVAREFSKIGFDTLLISSDSTHWAKYPSSEKIFNFEHYGNLLHMWIKTYKYSKTASIKRLISWIDFDLKLYKFSRLNNKKPDVVVISSLPLSSVLCGIFLKKKYKCKLVFEIRDIHPMTLVEEYGISMWNPLVILLGLIEKIAYNNADLIVGTMPNLRQHVWEVTGKERDVFHSPLGIHEIWYQEPLSSIMVDSLFPTGDKFVVGYAGSMGVANAMDSFIDAIKSMAQEKDIYFVLVGDGDLKDDFIQRLSKFDNVKIGPKIKQNEIPYFLSKCDLLYLSTHDSKIWEYGQSLNKLTDYMMSGKPVVASYSGYQTMLNEANSGVFIPTKDVGAIVKAIKSFKDMAPSIRALYGIRGKTWIEKNYEYKNIARSYYNRIMKLFDDDDDAHHH